MAAATDKNTTNRFKPKLVEKVRDYRGKIGQATENQDKFDAAVGFSDYLTGAADVVALFGGVAEEVAAIETVRTSVRADIAKIEADAALEDLLK